MAEWPNLKVLDLSNNQITQLESVVDWKFPKLETLMMNDNRIRSLRPFTVVKWENIVKIEVRGVKLEGSEAIEKLCFADESIRKKFWRIF